jgi:hypothetical protein
MRTLHACALTVSAALLLSATAPAAVAEKSLVVCLPASTVESAARLGEAVTDLGAYLDKRVPELKLVVRPFRRSEDAMSYVQAQGRDVVLLLTETPFLLDLPTDFQPLPACRVVRGGKETQRKVVAVGATGTSLAALQGKSISLALSGGDGSARFLARAVFDGALVPESWFGKLVSETDEFTATANVLFGRSDAALVSEDNPLLLSHLGKELKTVYTSPPVSLPVLSYRGGALTAAQQAAIETALVALPRAEEGKKILDGLHVEGFARVRDADRAGLLTVPSEERRAAEVAILAVRDLVLPALPGPDAAKVPFLLGLTLPDLPMPVLEAGKPR